MAELFRKPLLAGRFTNLTPAEEVPVLRFRHSTARAQPRRALRRRQGGLIELTAMLNQTRAVRFCLNKLKSLSPV